MEPMSLLQTDNLIRRVGVAHGFTTRAGGVSVGPLASLNLARRPDERPEALEANWDRVAHALDPRLDRRAVALLAQVHGAHVVEVRQSSGPLANVAEADGAVTTVAGLILAVRVADCVPVLLASPHGIGVAHAGWRGAAAGVVTATVHALCRASASRPSDVSVAIGPHIRPDRFEVGEEVVEALVAGGIPASVFVRAGFSKPHVDLAAYLRAQLMQIGVYDVDDCGGCSVSDPVRFFSHRAGGPDAGRMAGVIVRR